MIAFFQDFGLLAYSRTGKRVWSLKTDPVSNNHGMASSPVLADDVVIQVLAGDTGSRVLAVDSKKGTLRWEAALVGVTYATPLILSLGSNVINVVVASTGEIVAYDVRNGKKIWWLGQVPYQPKSSPIVSPEGNSVFVAIVSVSEETARALSDFDKLLKMWDVNGDSKLTQAELVERKGPAGGFPQIDMNGDGVFDREEHSKVMAVAAIPHLMAAIPTNITGDVTGKLTWIYRKSVPNVPSPLLYDGVLYAIKEGGIGTSLDPTTGALLKEGRIAPAFGPVFSSPVGGDGKIYTLVKQERLRF